MAASCQRAQALTKSGATFAETRGLFIGIVFSSSMALERAAGALAGAS